MAYNPYGATMNGVPIENTYTPGYNPLTMSSLEDYQNALKGINLNTQGLDAFRAEALRKGASPWARLTTKQTYAQEADARERAKREAASNTANAEAELAMRGGISSGARERVATSGARDALAMSQDVGRQGNLNRMQVGINDEQNRITQLSQLPGMENVAYQGALQKENLWKTAKDQDTQRLIDENNRRQAYNTNTYNQQMQAWAAKQQANATEAAGKK